MDDKQPLADRLLARLRNNPVAAAHVVAAVVLGGVAGFTDSVRRLIELFPHREAAP